MKVEDVLYCIEEYSKWFYGKQVNFNFGDKCRVSDIRKCAVIIKNSKGDDMFFYIDEIEKYFETVNEHRSRIIEDLI